MGSKHSRLKAEKQEEQRNLNIQREKDKDAKQRVGEGRDKPDKEDWSRKRKGTKGRDHDDPNLLAIHSGGPELEAPLNSHENGEWWTQVCKGEPPPSFSKQKGHCMRTHPYNLTLKIH